MYFYPRSPCGERHLGARQSCDVRGISIHALLAESDFKCSIRRIKVCIFLSTLSLRRATKVVEPGFENKLNFYPRSPCGERPIPYLRRYIRGNISIHALLAESDSKIISSSAITIYFYPRSPCGERLGANNHVGIRERFLSTLSLRRAT